MKRTFNHNSRSGKRAGALLLLLLLGFFVFFIQSSDGRFEDFNLIDPDLKDSLSVSLGHLLVAKGDTGCMEIAFDNNNPISSFNMEIVLPQGVSVVKEAFKCSKRIASWYISIRNGANGSYIVSGTPKGNYLLQRGNGEVLSLSITASESAIETNHNIEIATHSFLSYNTMELDPMVSPSTLTITPPLLSGDFNGDGMVDTADIARATSHIIENMPPDLNPKITDLNKDGRLSVTDIAGMAGRIEL